MNLLHSGYFFDLLHFLFEVFFKSDMFIKIYELADYLDNYFNVHAIECYRSTGSRQNTYTYKYGCMNASYGSEGYSLCFFL